jgi:hypothetical protein
MPLQWRLSLESTVCVWRRGGDTRSRPWSGEPLLINVQGVRVGDDDGPLDHILQLSSVARLVIQLEEAQCLLADPVGSLAGALGEPVGKVLDKKGDVRRTFAQGRHDQQKDV